MSLTPPPLVLLLTYFNVRTNFVAAWLVMFPISYPVFDCEWLSKIANIYMVRQFAFPLTQLFQLSPSFLLKCLPFCNNRDYPFLKAKLFYNQVSPSVHTSVRNGQPFSLIQACSQVPPSLLECQYVHFKQVDFLTFFNSKFL